MTVILYKHEISDLYFVGLPWLHLLFGVAEDAAYIASAIDREAWQQLANKITEETIAV